MQKHLLPRLPQLLLLVFTLALFSCNSSEPIKDSEAISFAHQVEKSIIAHDASLINNMLDKDELSKRIASKAGMTFNFSFKKGLMQGLEKMNLGNEILNAGGTYQLVKQYVKNNRQHLIFRLFGSSGINYHDYELTKHKGKIYVADMYLYLMGQDLSEIVGRTANVYKDKDMDETTYMRGAAQIKAMEKQLQADDYTGAQETYRLIPQPFKKNKICRMAQIQISLGLEDTAAYNRQVQAYIEDFPGNPDIYMLQLDAGFMHKDYQGLMLAINNLDHFIDKDPFLDYYRGLTYKLMEKPDSSSVYFARLHKSFPEMQEALVELIVSDLNAGKTDEARTLIAEYRKTPAYNQQMLAVLATNHPEYAAYLE